MTIAPEHLAIDDAYAAVVRASPIIAGLIDLETRRIIEVSDPVVEMLRQPRENIVGSLLSRWAADAALTNETVDLLSRGLVEGYRTHREIRREDGSLVPVVGRLRRVASDGDRDLGLGTFELSQSDSLSRLVTVAPGPVVIGTFGQDFRLLRISGSAVELLGRDPANDIGHPVFNGTHRDDHADVLIATGQVLAGEPSVSIRVRVRRGDKAWLRVRLAITMLDPDLREFGFVMEPAVDIEEDTRTDLLDRMRRIATQVQGAGIIEALDSAAGLKRMRGIDDLSDRQREILVRILDGARVPAIARELYVSPSTVRNQLASIFRKVGVHSQAELVEALRDAP